MPVLNSLIAQRHQQTSLMSPVPPSFEGSNNLLMQIFQPFDEQRFAPNLLFASIGSEAVGSTAENVGEGTRSGEAGKEFAPVSKQESIFDETKSNNHLREHKEGKRQVISMLTDSDVKFNKHFFTEKDFGRSKELFVRKKKHPEKTRSLSKRSKNEIVRKEYYRVWLHRLLQQANTPDVISSSSNVDETRCTRGTLTLGSDDRKSCASALSADSSRSLQLERNDITVARKEESPNENS